MIDNIDRQIILMLRNNGRESHINIARELNLYVSTVAKRVETLLANEVISIQAVPNPYKLGYKANAFITLDADIAKVKSICAELSVNHNVSTVVTCFGRYDIHLIVDFSEWEILHGFVKENLSRIDGVNKVEIFLIAEIKKRYNGIFDDDNIMQAPIMLNVMEQKLVEELMKNGRASYTYLADKLGVSIATLSRKITYLVNEKIIRIIAVPNPSKLGFPANANLAISVKPDKVDDVCKELAKYESVYMIMTLMNGFEILAGVNFPSPEMLYDFILGKISMINGVTNIETIIRAQIIKAIYAHLDPDGFVR